LSSSGIRNVHIDVVGPGDLAKKLRALHKKLRQIEETRAKATETGVALTASQLEKQSQESSLREEVKHLEAQLTTSN
jgi:hypothetical protein